LSGSIAQKCKQKMKTICRLKYIAYRHRSAAKMYRSSFLERKVWKTLPSVPLIMLLWLDDHQFI